MDNLICFLSRNGIEHLVLRYSKYNPYKLPSSFFECLQMRHLTLQHCSVHPPPDFKGFHNLVSLELCEVTISSEVLGNIISCSPSLEKLVLRTLSIFGHIQIKAPKLRSFEFTGSIKSISLKKSPLLGKLQLLDIEESEPSEESGKHDFATYFESFPALELLHLNNRTILFLAAGSDDIPSKLSSALSCLKSLCLSDVCLDESVDVLLYAICLIRSSPYLQDIHMKVRSGVFDGPVPSDEVGEIAARFSDVSLNHLRTIKLEGITGTKPEMQLIKLMSAKTPKLVTILIKPGFESTKTNRKIIKVIKQKLTM